jgi:hypothetical protein
MSSCPVTKRAPLTSSPPVPETALLASGWRGGAVSTIASGVVHQKPSQRGLAPEL